MISHAYLKILTKHLKYKKEYRSEIVKLVEQSLWDKVLQMILILIIQFCPTMQAPVTDTSIP